MSAGHHDDIYSDGVIQVRLRAVRIEDLPKLLAGSEEDDPFGSFSFGSSALLTPMSSSGALPRVA